MNRLILYLSLILLSLPLITKGQSSYLGSGASITFPLKNSLLRGYVFVSWFPPHFAPEATAYFQISDDDKVYTDIGQDVNKSGRILFDSRNFKDGVFYRIKATIFGTGGLLLDVLHTNYFTINNEGNASPQIRLFSPVQYKILSGNQEIKWKAGDAEMDDFTINIYYRPSFTSDWETVAEGLNRNDTTWIWNTAGFANSSTGSLMVKAVSVSDTAKNEYSIIQPIALKNGRDSYGAGDIIVTSKGSGTGLLYINKINRAALTGHVYLVTFDSTGSNRRLAYNVTDLTLGKTVLSNCTATDGSTESPYFDGIRLLLKNDEIKVINHLSGFRPSFWYFQGIIRNSFDTAYARSFPYDYVIEFRNAKDIPSFSSGFPYNGPEVNFTVRNLTKGYTVPVLVYDTDKNNMFNIGDEFSIVEFTDDNNNGINEYSERKYSWTIPYKIYVVNNQPIEPDTSHKLYINVYKPFIKGDEITFLSRKLANAADNSQAALDYRLFQNYPNPFNPVTSISYSIAEQSLVELKVYDLLGREITTLENRVQKAGKYSIRFDGSSLSSGIYIYTIRAGSFRDSKKLLLLK